MKSHLLITTIAAVVLVGCGESQQSAPAPEAKPAEPVAEAAQPKPTTPKAVTANKGADPARGIKPEPPAANAIDPWDKWLRSIHRAAQNGNIEDVKQHIAAGTDVNAKARGYTPLHNAAEFQRLGAGKKIVELLIAKGADVNATDGDGDTPLHLAGNSTATKEIAELLISKGAGVNAMNLSPPRQMRASSDANK